MDDTSPAPKPKRKPRPKKPSTRTQMSLYLSDHERAAIDRIRGEMERSAWIRLAVLEKLDRQGARRGYLEDPQDEHDPGGAGGELP